MGKITIDNLTGGENLREPNLLKDNQFALLKNFYYDKDKRCKTRLGTETYFATLPDTVVLLDAMNATTGWTGTEDAVSVTTGTAIRGTFALQFGITVATNAANSATLTKTTISASIAAAKGYLGFWLFVPTGFNTNLTAVKFRLGSDSSNYYEWTLGTLLMNTSQFIKLSFANATTTGTPVDATITYARLQVTYTGAYTDQAAIRIDDLQAYSSTYTKPVTSYFFNRNESDSTNITIAVAGANMFLYNETAVAWERINSGLTEYETQTGRTSQRTRWAFFAIKVSGGIEVGMGNGVDDYRVWNGVTITEYAGQPKCRYFLYFQDKICSAGEDLFPFRFYFTNAAPSTAATINTNDVDVGNEFDGKINGLFELASTVLIGKTEKIYYVSFADTLANSTCLPIDAQNGLFSHRVTNGVGNAILYQTKNGIDNLSQKQYSTGGTAIVSENYTADLQKLTGLISANQYNANCGGYIKELNNFYFSFDTGDDNVPETTLVYSSLIGKTWSEYTYPAAYQYGYYIDSANAYNYLLCSGNAGIIYKIEKGFSDDGVPIEYEFKTKEYDFGNSSSWKDLEYIDLFGRKNEGSEFEIEVIVGGEVVYTATITDDYLTSSVAVSTVGSDPIGTETIGGGAQSSEPDSIDVFPYQIRLGAEIFASGHTVQIRGFGDDVPTVFTLDQIQIKYENNTDDLFPVANFA